MNVRELLGILLVAVGFLAVFDRTVASVFTLNGLFVAGVGLLAVVLGLNYFNTGRAVSRRSTPIEDVEPRYEVPVPGDEADETLSVVTGFSPDSIRNRRDFHQELRAVAVETLSARGDYANESAVETALRTGTWTDDPVAGWFLGEQQSPPLTVRVRGLLGADTEFAFAAKRTIGALVEARDVALEEPPDGDESPELPADGSATLSGSGAGQVQSTGRTTATTGQTASDGRTDGGTPRAGGEQTETTGEGTMRGEQEGEE